MSRGFSPLEILGVVALGGLITVSVLPSLTADDSGNAHLRSNMATVYGVLEHTRTLAVDNNRTLSTRFLDTSQGLTAFVTRVGDTTSSPADSDVEVRAPLSRFAAPSGPNAPMPVAKTRLGFVPQDGDPSFNSAGEACVYSRGHCLNQGFLYYFKDTRSEGPDNWAALSISPAGELKEWFWNGVAWTH
jgi:type II secretory pathway pseudopilin PulG